MAFKEFCKELLEEYKWAFNHNKIIERIILLKQYIQNDRHKHFS